MRPAPGITPAPGNTPTPGIPGPPAPPGIPHPSAPPASPTSLLRRLFTRLFLGFVAVSIIVLLTDLVIIRGYGPTGHGQFSLTLSLAIMLAAVGDLGLASKAAVRTIAQLHHQQQHRALGQAVGRLILTLATVGLLAAITLSLIAPLLAPRLGLPAFAIHQAAIWLLASLIIRAALGTLIGLQRMGAVAILSTIAEASRLAWAGVCAIAALDLNTLYLGLTITWLASMLACLAVVAVTLAGLDVRVRFTPLEPARVFREARDAIAYLPPVLTAQALPWLTLVIVGFALPATNNDTQHPAISILKLTFTAAMVLRMVAQPLATSLFPLLAQEAGIRDQGSGIGGQGSAPPTPGHAASAAWPGSTDHPTLHAPHSTPQLSGALLQSATRTLALASLAITAVYLLLGPTALALLDRFAHTDHLYAAATPTLILLTLTFAADGYRTLLDQPLLAAGTPRPATRGELLKLLLLTTTLPLMLQWSPTAPAHTAAATVLAIICLITLQRLWSCHRHHHPTAWKPAALTAATLTLMTLLLFLLTP